ncbi:hypothetical protein JCM10212_007067 [Sporobolomyces blumeae]
MAIIAAAGLLLVAFLLRRQEAASPSILASEPSATTPSARESDESSSGKTIDSTAAPATASTSSPSNSSISVDSGNSSSSGGVDDCFPLGSVDFPASGPPSFSRDEWWCSPESLYGFLGFSYPLEVSSCDDPSNSFDKIKSDLERMKREFGATMVRPYAVQCRDVSVWEHLVKACAENGMGLVAHVWWGFQDDQTLWEKTQSSLYELFETSEFANVAPYVVHSVSFGSEPVGDGVLGGDFVAQLGEFRTKMNAFGIPVSISEDWDRGQLRDGDALSDLGSSVLDETDVAHLHTMPYYHPDVAPLAGDAWSYASEQIVWARKHLDQPTLVTQSMWSSQKGGSHGRGGHDDEATPQGYKTYWNAFATNCAFWKEQQVGYFVHTFDDLQEPYFGMVDASGETKISGWKPKRC